MQGITNAFTRGSERVYARQQTRLSEAANAVTRKRKRVHKRRLTRLHEAENACPRDSERDHTQTQTRSHEEAKAFTGGGTHEAPEANAFARTRQRTHFRGAENVITYAYAYARMTFFFLFFFPVYKNIIYNII